MRVGRPVPSLPQPICDYCGAKARFVSSGEDGYPYRDDHGPLWTCTPCEAWIGIFPRSTRRVPLGRLANAELRDWKARLHAALEPMVQAKVRRDGSNVFEARAKGYRWLAGEMKIDEDQCTIHHLDADQCKAAIDIIERFEQRRRGDSSAS
ncbi:zinc-finger-containing protein [Paraburkholderia megapolitana]|uniref:zinc-finger-containing protein n=1 Tax=Paraburkholderia megapolitana TaxID=420953 RepID=UPI0038BB2F5F